jgi:trigger factor
MKKRVIALLLCAMTAVAMTGCGNNGENADSTEIAGDAVEGTEAEEAADAGFVSMDFNYTAGDLVTLCDYSSIPVELTDDYEVNDDDVTDYLETLFSYYGPFYTADDTKTTVEEGDIVNVDYVGKVDGEAFDGGTAESQNIDVYNNTSASGSGFIDGFSDGLKGASVGDVVDWDVTFPEDYSNEDLAGQPAVFTFTVNSIQKEITVDEVDDAFAQENFGVDTVDEMKEEIKSYLESSASSSKDSAIYTALQDYLLDNCTVEVPEDYLAARTYNVKQQFINSNCDGDESQLETYLSTYYGITVEEAETQWEEMMDENIRLELIMEAICDAENIEADESGYQSYVDTLVSSYGVDSAEDLYKTYGYDNAEWGENYFKIIYRGNLAFDQLKETAAVTVVEPEETESTEEATEEAIETESTEDTQAAE